MKRLWLLLIAILIVIPVFSQLEKGYIHLKNGTVLKGKYQYSNDKIHIVSAGNIWTFEKSEVDTITGIRGTKIKQTQDSVAHYDIFYRIEAGLLLGNSQNNQSAPFSFSGSVNYHLTPEFSLGMGLGVEFLKESYLPAFINLEYKFKDNLSSPYAFLKVGYEVALEDGPPAVYYDVYPNWSSIWPGPYPEQNNLDPDGGMLVNPGIGYTYMFSYNFGISIAAGYQFHRLQYKNVENDYRLDIDYNRLTLKIGILLN